MKWWRHKKREEQGRRQATSSEDDEYRFRRSRTMPGNYTESNERTVLQSERLQAQKRLKRRRWTMVIAGVLLLATGAIIWMSFLFSGAVRVVSFVPEVTKQPDTAQYEATIQEYLRTRPMSRFAFLLDEAALSQHVSNAHKEVKAVEMMGHSAQAFLQGKFRATLREPIVGWDSGRSQYWVDETGVAFRENYYKAPEVTIRDESGITPEAQGDDMFVSLRFLQFLGRIVALTAKHTPYTVDDIVLPPGLGARSIEVHIAGQEYPVRMHSDRDPAKQVEDMQRVMGYMQERDVHPQYIDVRVAGRAFYRE